MSTMKWIVELRLKNPSKNFRSCNTAPDHSVLGTKTAVTIAALQRILFNNSEKNFHFEENIVQ